MNAPNELGPEPPRLHGAWTITTRATGEEICGNHVSAEWGDYWKRRAELAEQLLREALRGHYTPLFDNLRSRIAAHLQDK